MASNILPTIIVVFMILNISTASRQYRHDAHERHCGTRFLEKSSLVKELIDRENLCDESELWQAEWYGKRMPRTEGEMSNFCCKIQSTTVDDDKNPKQEENDSLARTVMN